MAGEQSHYEETGRCHTQARRWPLMIGNQGWRWLNVVGAPWPLPQLVALAGLFAVCWQLRPLFAAAVGGPASLLVCVVVPAAGSLPMRRTRIAGRVPWRWTLGQVALLTSPVLGRPTGTRAVFTRPYRVGGGYWLIPAGTALSPRPVHVPAAPRPVGAVTAPAATGTRSQRPAAVSGRAANSRPGRPERPVPAVAAGVHLVVAPLSTVEAMRALLSA